MNNVPMVRERRQWRKQPSLHWQDIIIGDMISNEYDTILSVRIHWFLQSGALATGPRTNLPAPEGPFG